MAQAHEVMAFRKRLKKRGYTGIHILKLPPEPEKRPYDLYLVQAVEPLAGMGVRVEMDIVDMFHAFQ